jgi:hypothetical protein
MTLLYSNVDVAVQLHHMSRRLQIAITEAQYQVLHRESERSSVSIAELVRRAIDTTYELTGPGRVLEITHVLGRRAGIPLDHGTSSETSWPIAAAHHDSRPPDL